MVLVLYEVVRYTFKAASGVFYASFDVRGTENVPPDGVPTLLCFNHGNSLGDPVVLIANTPKSRGVVHFCAKDTLWQVPFFSTLIRLSGAIPVYRTREHGERAKEFNAETFKAVYAALDAGKCVAFAPEGVSRFQSYATKFKSGVAHIAIETVLRAKVDPKLQKDDFKVFILPAVMAWTHREKFRSDVLVRFIKPMAIDSKYLSKFCKISASNGNDVDLSSLDRKACANAIIDELENEFRENVVNAPDWLTIKLAITATRIHRPLGTYMALSTYMYFLRGWIEIIKLYSEHKQNKLSENVCQTNNLDSNKIEPSAVKNIVTNSADNLNGSGNGRKVNCKDSEEFGNLLEELENYQHLLDGCKVKDERFRRVEILGYRDGQFLVFRNILYRLMICVVLFTICSAGLFIWSPFWYLIRVKERSLLQRGIGWVDSLAEHKMMYGAMFIAFITVVFVYVISMYAEYQSRTLFAGLAMILLFWGYLWLTMRLYEEAVASARSVFGIIRLFLMDDASVKAVVQQRKKTKEEIWKAVKHFPKTSAQRIKQESGDDIFVKVNTHEQEIRRPKWYENFDPFRRRKKDWNELLRFSDYCTMDYVE